MSPHNANYTGRGNMQTVSLRWQLTAPPTRIRAQCAMPVHPSHGEPKKGTIVLSAKKKQKKTGAIAIEIWQIGCTLKIAIAALYSEVRGPENRFRCGLYSYPSSDNSEMCLHILLTPSLCVQHGHPPLYHHTASTAKENTLVPYHLWWPIIHLQDC